MGNFNHFKHGTFAVESEDRATDLGYRVLSGGPTNSISLLKAIFSAALLGKRKPQNGNDLAQHSPEGYQQPQNNLGIWG